MRKTFGSHIPFGYTVTEYADGTVRCHKTTEEEKTAVSGEIESNNFWVKLLKSII
jgi:hypothetical protein